MRPGVVGRVVGATLLYYVVLFALVFASGGGPLAPETVLAALVPFAFLLVFSERLDELRFGDISMTFQRTAGGTVSSVTAETVFAVDGEDVDTFDEERSLDPDDSMELPGGRLVRGPPKVAQHVRDERPSTLEFTLGERYPIAAIEAYVRANLGFNPEFRYVLFTDEHGRFRGVTDADRFVASLWASDEGVAADIESGAILERLPAIRTQLQAGSTRGEARRKLAAADVDALAVVDLDERFVGVVTEAGLGAELLEGLLGEVT